MLTTLGYRIYEGVDEYEQPCILITKKDSIPTEKEDILASPVGGNREVYLEVKDDD